MPATTATAEREPASFAGERLDHLRQWMHVAFRGMPRDTTVLALGCDQAFLASQLAEYAADVTVLDTAASQLAQLARRFPEVSFLAHDPAKPLPFAHDTFDAIWCCEFLDRVFDPAAALREMHRVLVPAGRLLLTVPDHGAMRNVLIALFRWNEHFAPSSPRIRHFTRSSLVRLARDAGWTEIHTTRGGAVRRIAGDLVPRSLLLRARKGPAVPQRRAARRAGQAPMATNLAEQLAYAGRGPAVWV